MLAYKRIIPCMILLFAACSADNPIAPDLKSPEMRHISFLTDDKLITSNNTPYISFTLKNDGNVRLTGIWVQYKAYDANDVLVDTGEDYSIDDLDPGQTASGEVLFFDIASHNDYVRLERIAHY